MEHRIFKYRLDLDVRSQTVTLPAFARILSVQVQHGEAQLWAMVQPSAAKVTRAFEIYVTGATVERPEDLFHLATLQLHGGSIIVHVFERIRQ